MALVVIAKEKFPCELLAELFGFAFVVFSIRFTKFGANRDPASKVSPSSKAASILEMRKIRTANNRDRFRAGGQTSEVAYRKNQRSQAGWR